MFSTLSRVDVERHRVRNRRGQRVAAVSAESARRWLAKPSGARPARRELVVTGIAAVRTIRRCPVAVARRASVTSSAQASAGQPAESLVGVSADAEVRAVDVWVSVALMVAGEPGVSPVDVETVVGCHRAQDHMCPAFGVGQHGGDPVGGHAGVGVGVRQPDLAARGAARVE